MSAVAGGGRAEEPSSAAARPRTWRRLRPWLEVVGPLVAVVALGLSIANSCRQTAHQARVDDAEIHRLVAQAEEHLQRGELEEARHDLRAAGIYGQSEELTVLEARYRALTGDREGGIALLRRATLARPDSVPALFHLGRLLKEAGDLDGARTHLERAAGLAAEGAADVGRAVILVNLGDVLLAQQDAEAAKATYQQALEADPRSPDAHARMGDVYIGEARFDEALREIGRALSADPENPRHLLAAAIASYYADSFAQAEDLARRSLRAGETAEALEILALALEDQGKDSSDVRQRLQRLHSGAAWLESVRSEAEPEADAPDA